jgi:hypothetical protein
MPTYIYCKPCNKLYDKEFGCLECLAVEACLIESHEPNQTTLDAMNEC